MQGVIVNGKSENIKHQQCSRCVQDSSIPGIKFDEQRVCNFCHFHDNMEKIFPNGEAGQKILQKIVRSAQQQGRKQKFDCVVGVSGGRDSIYLLWVVVKEWMLRPLAVHFDDGFDNPIASENMVRACEILGVELRTISSDWIESKELKIDFLKASTPDLNMGTDIGIASSLYGVAHKESMKTIFIGQSFRTEGIKPLSWSFLDGKYLYDVHRKFGKTPLRNWSPSNPGFNFRAKHILYYSFIKGIKVFTPFYYYDYIRNQGEEIIKKELGWVYPGAHYFDDLYHSLIKYVHRVKFNIDMNMNSDSALVRSGQMQRDQALQRVHGVYSIEDPKVIDMCIKKLGLTREEFDEFMNLPPKTFRDYNTIYRTIKTLRLPIKWMSELQIIPRVTYDKYFNIGN